MDDATASRVLAAIMHEAGVTEIRVTDEAMVRNDQVVVRHRDEMADVTVFRLVTTPPTTEGEEVPLPIHAIGAGT